MDWVIIEVCTDAACSTAYQVFNWYNGVIDTNTNIGAAGYTPGEPDNAPIPAAVLRASGSYQTGIEIDIDAVAPPGIYQYIRISVPLGGDNDAGEVDSIEVLP